MDEPVRYKNAHSLLFYIHISATVFLYRTLPSSGTKAGLVNDAFIARASGVMRVEGTMQSSIGSSSTVRASRMTSATCAFDCTVREEVRGRFLCLKFKLKDGIVSYSLGEKSTA